ncbi:dihydrolipoamide acetyltransferase family protein [Nonomuraea sp. NPDC048916]|uniref:dihydrolipoamide acetyltransferase family protein n=1 Tax=Nonomuraea sp. NPDC048916 TaxID=3154232 RepID=UPI0033D0A93E
MSRYEFKLPDVGEGLEEAEIIEWHVRPGDTVGADQVVVSVETAKSVVELPIPVGGRIATVCGEAGTVVPVGGVLMAVTTDAESADVLGLTVAEDSAPGRGEATTSRARSTAVLGPTAAPRALRIKASPLVRRMAKERGVDLDVVTASGPNGRVTRADLERHVAEASATTARPPADPAIERKRRTEPGGGASSSVPFRGVRARIASVLTESIKTVPHIYDWRTTDVSALLDLKRRLAGMRPEGHRLSLVSLLARITLAGLRRHPILNARLDVVAGRIHIDGVVDLGLAIAGPEGLVVPVVKNAHALTLTELNDELRRLTDGALDRTLPVSDMGRATFTVNNLGPLGADHGSPLLRVGEAGAVAFGAVRDGVVAREGRAVVAPTMGVTVVGDHRVLDGSDLCAFTNTILRFIEEPDLLLTEL